MGQKLRSIETLDGKILSVLSRNYTIQIKKKIKNGHLWGQTNHGKQVIKISTKQTDESARDTLLHEVLHCVWYSLAFADAVASNGEANALEEMMVSSLASTLLHVLDVNPWLADFLLEDKTCN